MNSTCICQYRTFEQRLKTLFASSGLEFTFWKKRKLKTEMTVMFKMSDGSYWTIVGHVECWKEPDEHDDLFYWAIKHSLDEWKALKS